MPPAPSSNASARAFGPAARRRPRLHHIYYLLAAFDLVTVSLSLFIIYRITNIYSESVQVNQIWANRLGDYSELNQLAAAVNAPGNDVFETGDAAAESDRFEQAYLHFQQKADEVRADLAANIESERADDLLAGFDAVESAMSDMAVEARGIFRAIGNEDSAAAGARMAAMDRRYAAVNTALGQIGSLVRDIQQANLHDQTERAHDVRKLELLIAGLIVLMIVGVTFYGHRLAQQAKRQAQVTEEMVRERTRELEESHERLRLAERLASIGTLAAGLGHDMNNVLFPMRCRLDVLETADLDESVRDELASIRRPVEYLQRLCDGLRLLSLDPEERGGTDESTVLASWWQEVQPLVRTALAKEIRLESSLPADLPPVALEPHRLTQAVFNLVVNAGEAISGEGLVRISGEVVSPWHGSSAERRAVLTARDAGESTARPSGRTVARFVRVSVSDTGEGMSEEVRRRALDPFFTTKKRSFSTGLGLALVQSVVNAAGGSAAIESKQGRGTTVSLTLPVTEGAAIAGGDEDEGSRPQASITLTDRRIASFVAAVLQARGFQTTFDLPESDGDARLWVCDPQKTSISEVERFTSGRRDRRVIGFGPGDREWTTPRAVLIDVRHGIEGLRAAIASATSELEEPS